MLKSWRSWVLIVLLVGPFAAYIGLGFLWLLERGWLVATLASIAWIASGVVLYLLAERWTKSTRSILPPIDWGSPADVRPGRPRGVGDRPGGGRARRRRSPLEPLTGADLYIDTGRRLMDRLAKHYHPIGREAARRRGGRRADHGAGAGGRRPRGPLPPGPRRRPDHPRPLEDRRPGRRLHPEGEQHLQLSPAPDQPGDRPAPARLAAPDDQAGVEVDAGEHAPLVLPDVRQPPGDAPDRALQRPARHRRGEVSQADAEDGGHGLEPAESTHR